MLQVHLDKKDYYHLINNYHLKNHYHIIVLDRGIACLIRYIIIEDTLYYEDDFYLDDCILDKKYDYYEKENLHAEIYQKLALILKCYS